MRNMAVLHSPAFSYPLPVLVRVLFNLLIFKGKTLYYNKYRKRRAQRQVKTKFSNLTAPSRNLAHPEILVSWLTSMKSVGYIRFICIFEKTSILVYL